ncbi:helix-turn-helix transcriptional regulator [Rhodococcus hoagii]|uniref:helix-turn-helix transcriptional regulator n=1 Tax=Rhodococcus hoagii TaxID=43767 RepID=UPI0019FA11F7|nr:LuxR C-terminal-related transcriptional regulator [Prescottella equi]NKR32408.1 helix-turn-helix transcriptional regulator [Prescottella equi]NKS35612.1 helix-turn-helix transcriptional regulator [Prescottella equi]NKS58756.1 helix-turn-helix transcriptional regulator [Prescottella equi]NKS68516.1 helix-turn-helix transcriptional regulator [Prescottella equi]BCN85407.1 helix-turn-helix transcriptional regulator [Prescottella equi]
MSETGTDAVLDGLRDVLVGRLSDIGRRFSALLADTVPHTALVIFTRECTGRPRKVAGDPAIVDRVTIAELDSLRADLDHGRTFRGRAEIAGRPREVYAILDRTDTLLVIVPSGTLSRTAPLESVRSMFGIVATGIQLQVQGASPAYLAESRAASAERARTVAELTEVHATTLETLLATLRSGDLDDTRARAAAREAASGALIRLRTTVDTHRELAEESVVTAFARLRGELRGLLRHRDLELDLVEPAVDGRAVPGEVAHGARAVVRGAVLSLSTQTGLSRIRVAWTCSESELVVDIRDDGRGLADTTDLERQLRPRVDTLDGTLTTESTSGWGSRVVATLPLRTRTTAPPTHHALTDLGPRELEVLGHLVAGRRNRAIAERLGVSESTVKFHVAGVLRKLDVATRAEAAALAGEAGIRPVP